jgi:hypothetical protein
MRIFIQKPNAAQRAPLENPTKTDRECFGQIHAADSILRLQRTLGDRSVQRVLEVNAEAVEVDAATTSSARLGHDFGRIPVYAPGPIRIQPKLTVNTLNDSHEQEADRVSEQVVRMPEPGLQLTCACGGACPKCQMGKRDRGFEHLRMKSAAPTGAGFVEAPPIVHEVLSSPGQPLEPATRAVMESRFGHDFSRVRVHADAVAARSAEAVAAHAYTVGSDVVFGSGSYAPASRDGQRLLAHELAHVVQQDPERPVLRRFPGCRRLLSTSETGPQVSEARVQEFLADELEDVGDVEREFPVPGGSAAPWRTEGKWRDDTTIEPQLLDEWIKGRVDIALWQFGSELDFLEVKRASWTGAEFAERQVANYVAKANEAINGIQHLWSRRRRRRRGTSYSGLLFSSVREMPTSSYAPPDGPVAIGDQQVLLAWCRSGVMVFKALDVNNQELLYCGISDEGRTDAFIGRLLGKAEEMVAQALRRRLRELFPSDPVNIRPLLNRVRERLQRTIRWLLSEAIKHVCEAAIEVTVAAVLDRLRRMLDRNIVEGLLVMLTPRGEGIDPRLVGQAAKNIATVLTIGTILFEIGILAFA